MRFYVSIAACWLVGIAMIGCATTEVTERDRYRGEKLARPERILVYDFAGIPADLPAWSTARSRLAAPSTPPTAEELAAGRELGTEVANQLVEEIREMGLLAVRASGQPKARVGDIALVGYFTSIDEGSAMKRVVIGFGSGAAELNTQVEGYLMTDRGMEELGSGGVAAGGGKTPGTAIPLAVSIATSNPVGIIVSGSAKAAGELTGRTTIEGAARRTARAIAEELRGAFERQGWI